jgi:hypothetical protein
MGWKTPEITIDKISVPLIIRLGCTIHIGWLLLKNEVIYIREGERVADLNTISSSINSGSTFLLLHYD